MTNVVHYNTKSKTLIARCVRCGHKVEIPCNMKQLKQLTETTTPPFMIFPNVDRGDLEVLTPTGWCSVCFDGSIGYYRNATEKMDDDAHKIFSKLFPDEEPVFSVQDLYKRYLELCSHDPNLDTVQSLYDELIRFAELIRRLDPVD